MKNTWVASLETKDVYKKMDEQSDVLRELYRTDTNGYEKAVGVICEIMIDEFWREEAFEEGDYRTHMMYWKEEVKLTTYNSLLFMSFSKDADTNILSDIIQEILFEIKVHFNHYDYLWHSAYQFNEPCSCPACKK